MVTRVQEEKDQNVVSLDKLAETKDLPSWIVDLFNMEWIEDIIIPKGQPDHYIFDGRFNRLGNWVDHMYFKKVGGNTIDGNIVLISEPYNFNKEDFEKLYRLVQIHDLNIRFSGKAIHHEDCIRIEIWCDK